jgi:hypothetical protein
MVSFITPMLIPSTTSEEIYEEEIGLGRTAHSGRRAPLSGRYAQRTPRSWLLDSRLNYCKSTTISGLLK